MPYLIDPPDIVFVIIAVAAVVAAILIYTELKRTRRSNEKRQKEMVEEIRKSRRETRVRVTFTPEVLRRLVHLQKKAERKRIDQSRPRKKK